MNRVSDLDWGWWPVLSLRPPRDKDIDNALLLKITGIGGPLTGLVLFIGYLWQTHTISLVALVIHVILGCVLFFLVYKLTFAYFWNRRARQLRSEKTERDSAT